MDRSAGKAQDGDVERFLTAWFAVRQVIQAANFNHFHKAGLSATQFMTLNLLPVDRGSITIGELARRMNLKAATVAKTVDSLEDRGLLTRAKSAADGRLVLVSITAEGRQLQNAAVGQFRLHISGIFSAMAAKDRVALIQGLESLVEVAAARLIQTEPVQTDTATTVGGRAALRAKRSSPRSRPQ